MDTSFFGTPQVEVEMKSDKKCGPKCRKGKGLSTPRTAREQRFNAPFGIRYNRRGVPSMR